MARRSRNHQAGDDGAGLAKRVEAELAAQGLGPAVTDPSALRQVAGLLGADDPSARAKRLADVRRELAGVEVWMPLLAEPDQGTGEPW